MTNRYWDSVDQKLEQHSAYILNEAERLKIREAENAAYILNLPKLRGMLEEHKKQLDVRGFTTQLRCDEEGLKFTYSINGYYGPGGFRSAFHQLGPLVLAVLAPAGNSSSFGQHNDIDKNTEIGTAFDAATFQSFLEKNLDEYLDPNNLIISEENRALVRLVQGG